MLMSPTVRTLFWFLVISAATSLVFEAWRGRNADQPPPFRNSDDPGDPSSLVTHRGSHTGVDHRVLDSVRSPWNGDGTFRVSAIILNWSRFQNVVLIVSGLCDPRLQDVITEIVVWNNSPRKISAEKFDVSCASRLRIVNSPENLYFQARFMACSNTTSKYCFIQDDDYLVKPEVIRTLVYPPSCPRSTNYVLSETNIPFRLYSRISLSDIPKSIHLLPPHEHLSSTSLTGYSLDGRIHTRFAWLGHGTMIHRELSESFLSLMNDLGFTDEEKRMADNYSLSFVMILRRF
ncbi:hypothetical protein BDM02DRAFT_3267930, partial [Thelephora ganbajun]